MCRSSIVALQSRCKAVNRSDSSNDVRNATRSSIKSRITHTASSVSPLGLLDPGRVEDAQAAADHEPISEQEQRLAACVLHKLIHATGDHDKEKSERRDGEAQ
ncbi:hypothetical protein J1614_007069 [Plenodomus biglobosus]|nr:hypothetical protein J1614_007069 [Plenodomus biglobosus]